MIVHFSAHISKWELVCKFGVIFHIFIISWLCSRFHVRNQWFFYSVITFSYIKCFVHSYTVDVVFTLSYLATKYTICRSIFIAESMLTLRKLQICINRRSCNVCIIHFFQRFFLQEGHRNLYSLTSLLQCQTPGSIFSWFHWCSESLCMSSKVLNKCLGVTI